MAQRVSSGRRSRPPRGGAARTRVIGPLSSLADKCVILAAIAGGAALLYLGYGLLSGHITSFPHLSGSDKAMLPEPARATLISWVEVATRILSWAAVVGTLLALARYYDSSAAIGAAGAVGAFLYLGLPALVAIVLQQQYRQANQLTDIVIMGAQAGGKVLLVVAAARGAIQVFWSATRRPKRARMPRAVAPAPGQTMRPRSLLRPCWELARCRSAGSVCPALRQRRSCWKRGSGCMCDFKLAEALAEGAQAWAHEETAAVRYRAGQVRRPCQACPLYEEHQDYKFRVLAWLAYPATAGAIFLSAPLLHAGYERGLALMERAVAALTFMPMRGPQAVTPSGVQSVVLGSNVEWVFIGCLGLLAVTYVLQAIEHVIYKWGW